VGVERADPDTTAEIVGTLVDDHNTGHMNNLEEAAQAELQKLDAADQILEVGAGGRTRHHSIVRDRVVRKVEQGSAFTGSFTNRVSVQEL